MILESIDLFVSDVITSDHNEDYKSGFEVIHSFQNAMSCGNYEHWMIGINKIIFPRYETTEYSIKVINVRVKEVSYIVDITDTAYKMEANTSRGPIVYSFFQPTHKYNNEIVETHYFPLIPKRLNNIHFYVEDPFDNLKTDTQRKEDYSLIFPKNKYPIVIHYNLIKVPSLPEMSRLISTTAIISNTDSLLQYPSNVVNNFRSNFIKPLDTSYETGQPYMKLNSIVIPAAINFGSIIPQTRIRLYLNIANKVELNKPESSFSWAYEEGRELMDKIRYELFQNEDIHDQDRILTRFRHFPNGDAELLLSLPLFEEGEDDQDIKTAEQLKNQVKKCLEPYGLRVSFVNRKLHIRNTWKLYDASLEFFDESVMSSLGIDPYEYRQGRAAIMIPKHSTYKARRVHNVFQIGPRTLYIYADCADFVPVNNRSKRLLGIVDMSSMYREIKKHTDGALTFFHMLINNHNPSIVSINTDTLKSIQVSLETEDGIKFPFKISDSNLRTTLNLSFFKKI